MADLKQMTTCDCCGTLTPLEEVTGVLVGKKGCLICKRCNSDREVALYTLLQQRRLTLD